MRLYIKDTENYVDVNYYEDLCIEAANVVHRADYAEAEDEDGCTCYIVSADTAEYWSNVENMQYQLDNIKSDLAEAISAPMNSPKYMMILTRRSVIETLTTV